jgi:membrane protein DedA with SNARE-associated domain
MIETTILLVILPYTVIFASSVLIQDSGKDSVFGTVTSAVSSWISEFGYPAIFVAALLENLFPPIPSEVIFPLVGFVAYHNNLGILHAISMGLVGAIGSTIGAIIIYYLSLKIGKPTILKFGRYIKVSEKGFMKAELWFQKYGAIAVFSGRMAPAIRELISIPAGIGQMNIMKFTLFTFAGSAIWSVALTLVGYFLGDAWSVMANQLSSAFSVVAVFIIVTILVVIGLKYYSKRKSRHNGGNTRRL